MVWGQKVAFGDGWEGSVCLSRWPCRAGQGLETSWDKGLVARLKRSRIRAGLPSKVQGKAQPSWVCSLWRAHSHDGFPAAEAASFPKGPESHRLSSPLLRLLVILGSLEKAAKKKEFLPPLRLLFPSSLGNIPSPCSSASLRPTHQAARGSSHHPSAPKSFLLGNHPLAISCSQSPACFLHRHL